MKCSKCGKEIANDSNFCEYCGTKVGNNKKRKTIKIALIVLSVVIAMVGLGWGGVILSEYIEEQNTLARAKTLSAQGVDEWVDLALPSGTLWYGKNADGLFYNFDEAMGHFGINMPTKEQFDELINNCTCTWTGEGYHIEGRNGNSIFLPAAGYRSNALLDVGDFGIYWSSTHLELKVENSSYISKQAWGLALGHDFLNKLECNTYNCDIYSNFSVRLVHKPFERLEPSSSQNQTDTLKPKKMRTDSMTMKPKISAEQTRVKEVQTEQQQEKTADTGQAIKQMLDQVVAQLNGLKTIKEKDKKDASNKSEAFTKTVKQLLTALKEKVPAPNKQKVADIESLVSGEAFDCTKNIWPSKKIFVTSPKTRKVIDEKILPKVEELKKNL